MKKLFLLLFGLSTITWSCKTGSNAGDEIVRQNFRGVKMTTPQYVRWVEDKESRLKAEKTIDHFIFRLFYTPLEYVALRNLHKNNPTQAEMDTAISEISDMQYFTFTITSVDGNAELLKVGIKSNEEYFSRVEYFSFKMQEDLKLIDGSTEIPCSLFHFERSYGVSPDANFLLGFSLSPEEKKAIKEKKEFTHKDKTLVFDDKVLGSGTVRITIQAADLNNIPTLTLSKEL